MQEQHWYETIYPGLGQVFVMYELPKLEAYICWRIKAIPTWGLDGLPGCRCEHRIVIPAQYLTLPSSREDAADYKNQHLFDDNTMLPSRGIESKSDRAWCCSDTYLSYAANSIDPRSYYFDVKSFDDEDKEKLRKTLETHYLTGGFSAQEEYIKAFKSVGLLC